MFRYRIQAYNTDPGVGIIDEIVLTVTAADEADAVEKAKKLKVRQSYTIIEIEDLTTGRDLKKRG